MKCYRKVYLADQITQQGFKEIKSADVYDYRETRGKILMGVFFYRVTGPFGFGSGYAQWTAWKKKIENNFSMIEKCPRLV